MSLVPFGQMVGSLEFELAQQGYQLLDPSDIESDLEFVRDSALFTACIRLRANNLRSGGMFFTDPEGNTIETLTKLGIPSWSKALDVALFHGYANGFHPFKTERQRTIDEYQAEQQKKRKTERYSGGSNKRMKTLMDSNTMSSTHASPLAWSSTDPHIQSLSPNPPEHLVIEPIDLHNCYVYCRKPNVGKCSWRLFSLGRKFNNDVWLEPPSEIINFHMFVLNEPVYRAGKLEPYSVVRRVLGDYLLHNHNVAMHKIGSFQMVNPALYLAKVPEKIDPNVPVTLSLSDHHPEAGVSGLEVNKRGNVDDRQQQGGFNPSFAESLRQNARLQRENRMYKNAIRSNDRSILPPDAPTNSIHTPWTGFDTPSAELPDGLKIDKQNTAQAAPYLLELLNVFNKTILTVMEIPVTMFAMISGMDTNAPELGSIGSTPLNKNSSTGESFSDNAWLDSQLALEQSFLQFAQPVVDSMVRPFLVSLPKVSIKHKDTGKSISLIDRPEDTESKVLLSLQGRPTANQAQLWFRTDAISSKQWEEYEAQRARQNPKKFNPNPSITREQLNGIQEPELDQAAKVMSQASAKSRKKNADKSKKKKSKSSSSSSSSKKKKKSK
jgi:hypothetical protein